MGSSYYQTFTKSGFVQCFAHAKGIIVQTDSMKLQDSIKQDICMVWRNVYHNFNFSILKTWSSLSSIHQNHQIQISTLISNRNLWSNWVVVSCNWFWDVQLPCWPKVSHSLQILFAIWVGVENRAWLEGGSVFGDHFNASCFALSNNHTGFTNDRL